MTGDQYEGGLKYRSADERLLLTGAFFEIKEKNVATFDKQILGIAYYKAIGQVRHQGFELQAIGQITPQWQVNTGYAYLDPKVIADVDPAAVGQTQLFLPKQTYSLYTTYTLHETMLRGLSLGGGVRYVSTERTSYDGSTKSLPGYSLVDAALSYPISKWLVQVNAHNIFDRRYFINNYQSLFYGNLPGEPANFALSVRYTF